MFDWSQVVAMMMRDVLSRKVNSVFWFALGYACLATTLFACDIYGNSKFFSLAGLVVVFCSVALVKPCGETPLEAQVNLLSRVALVATGLLASRVVTSVVLLTLN